MASGRKCFGSPVRRGRVFYVYAEGAVGLHERVEAWKQHHAIDKDDVVGVDFYPGPIQLLEGTNVEQLIEQLAAEREPPVLVVFDTQARCTVGADENSAKEMGKLIDAAGRLAREVDCTVLLVHHPARKSKDMRGS